MSGWKGVIQGAVMNVNLKNRKAARLISEKQVLSVFHCGFDTKKNVRHRKNCKHSANRRHAQLLIKRVFTIWYLYVTESSWITWKQFLRFLPRAVHLRILDGGTFPKD